MEISNPIALQYVTNQGLASQLNTQANQLPVKTERFSAEQKIPAPTEDEQRLRSEEEKNKKQAAKLKEEQTENALVKSDQQPNSSQTAFSIVTYANNNNNVLSKFQNSPQTDSELNPVPVNSKTNQISTQIKSYIETSALSSTTSNISKIDFFI
ncbi:MAG: hypothetical protein QM479_05440 [Pseudomonadota bacterium]